MATESVLKHLEFIQSIISRLNNNSFLVKGWSITIASALFVLSDKQADRIFLLVPFFTIPSFWLLDGYYLGVERKFRDLFDQVRSQPHANEADFNMKISSVTFLEYAAAASSSTVIFFHGVLLLICIFILFIKG